MSYLDENLDEEYEDNRNPYEMGPWRGTDFFCIRCGSKLEQISKDNKHWGALWKSMLEDGTLEFLCPNKQCVHSDMPLTLHHPIYGIKVSAGDSYSLSWIE